MVSIMYKGIYNFIGGTKILDKVLGNYIFWYLWDDFKFKKKRINIVALRNKNWFCAKQHFFQETETDKLFHLFNNGNQSAYTESGSYLIHLKR